MDVAVVYNFAEHPGGGDLVALDIVEALLEKGRTVTLYTSTPEGVWKAAQYFDKNLRTFENMDTRRVEVPRIAKHPYNIYLITKKTLNELKRYDLVVFFDDIPKPALELKRILVYVHYPHAARIKCDVLRRKFFKENPIGKLVWRLHSHLFVKLFVTDNVSIRKNMLILVNSSLTLDHVRKLLGWDAIILYPPVRAKVISNMWGQEHKEAGVISVGRIEPEREYEILIKALAIMKSERKNLPKWVTIVGFAKDSKYLKWLINLAKEHGLGKVVNVETNASPSKVYKLLARGSIIVSTHPYEQFGIAVVEGMAAGCISVVRKGFNGPWIDILQRGRYGYGYVSPKELANTLATLIESPPSKDYRYKLMKRALEFDEEIFKAKLLEVIKLLAK